MVPGEGSGDFRFVTLLRCASRMNNVSSRTARSQKTPCFAQMWRAFLARASQPPWEERCLAETLFWSTPDEIVDREPVVHLHGEGVRQILSRYATILGVPLSFRTATNHYSPPDGGDAVHFHSFALPTPPVILGTWPRVPLVELRLGHGIPLADGAHRALAFGTQFGRGRPLLDQYGHVVGEYLGTNLYCLFDLLGQDAPWIPVLLRRHLDLGLPYLLPALTGGERTMAIRLEDRARYLREETEELIRAHRRGLLQNARETYISAYQERVSEEICLLQSEIGFLEAGVDEMARRIAADTRRLHEGRRRLRLLQGWRDQPESSGRELEDLQALPEVREARVQDGRISLTTSPILVEYGGRRYCLGSFQLDLHFNGDVRVVNLTDPVGAYDHPHIHQGRPSLGIIREGVAKLLGEFQFLAATEVMIDFLKTVNPAEWRLPVLHWPEAESEVGRGVLAAT
jgi:hypothetical protein